MAVKKKLAILAAAILAFAAAALWLRAASAGESTFIRAVTNEVGLRQIFTNLDEDVYSLQPRHRIELTPDGTSVDGPVYRVEYTFDIDGRGGYPPITVSGEATEYETPFGFNNTTGVDLKGEAVIDGTECEFTVYTEHNRENGDLYGYIRIMDKAWWGEPDRPETVVVVLGDPVVTYDMMKDAGLV